MLATLLDALARQDSRGRFTWSVVVADNDREQSAREVAGRTTERWPMAVEYRVEPVRNIALARNTSVRGARGEFIAIVDDDEVPDVDWLYQSVAACRGAGVAGVLGPVMPVFVAGAPGWVRAGGIYDARSPYHEGRVMHWRECRTGNVVFARRIIDGVDPVFDPAFGSGGEDIDFFRRMVERGHVFVWCERAIVREVVPPERWSRKFLLRRALLRGGIAWQHRKGRPVALAKSLLAIPLYSAALPLVCLAGQNRLMRHLIKLGDHAGRVLAAGGLRPVTGWEAAWQSGTQRLGKVPTHRSRFGRRHGRTKCER